MLSGIRLGSPTAHLTLKRPPRPYLATISIVDAGGYRKCSTMSVGRTRRAEHGNRRTRKPGRSGHEQSGLFTAKRMLRKRLRRKSRLPYATCAAFGILWSRPGFSYATVSPKLARDPAFTSNRRNHLRHRIRDSLRPASRGPRRPLRVRRRDRARRGRSRSGSRHLGRPRHGVNLGHPARGCGLRTRSTASLGARGRTRAIVSLGGGVNAVRRVDRVP